MHYTISSLNDVQFDQMLDLNKTGNKYSVYLYHKDTKKVAHKTFDNIGDAYAIFEKLARHICFGDYSFNDRMAMLA